MSKLRDYFRESYETWGLKGTLTYTLIYLGSWMLELAVAVKRCIAECSKSLVHSARGIYRQDGFLAMFWLLSPIKIVTILPDQEKLLMLFKPCFKKIDDKWTFCQEMNPRKICVIRKPKEL